MKEKIYSSLHFKCPRCLEGDFFECNNPYNLKKTGDVKEECSFCGLKYSPEPGFYIGAMYVSYAFGIAMFVAVWVALSVLYPDYSPMLLISFLFISLIGLGPYLYALSKIVWANMFFSYDEEYAQKAKEKKHGTTETKR